MTRTRLAVKDMQNNINSILFFMLVLLSGISGAIINLSRTKGSYISEAVINCPPLKQGIGFGGGGGSGIE